MRYRVDFLHRTVKDFLITKDMERMLSYWTAPEFDPHITICRTILAEIKTITPIPEYFEHVGSLSELVEELFAHVREVEILTNRTPRELLDELELTISTYAYKIYTESPHQALNIESYTWNNWTYRNNRFRIVSQDTFFTFAIERNLLLYTQMRFKENSSLLETRAASKGRPYLGYITNAPDRVWDEQERLHHLSLVALLLQQGANPNEIWHSTSVWGDYLDFLSDRTENWPRQLYYDLCKNFIVHGAELQKAVPYFSAGSGYEVTAWTMIPFQKIAGILPQQDVIALLDCGQAAELPAKKSKRYSTLWRRIKERKGSRPAVKERLL